MIEVVSAFNLVKQVLGCEFTDCLAGVLDGGEHKTERVTAIQKRMQHVSPALLSVTVFNGDSYIIQEMQPVKDNFNFKFVKDRYRDMYQIVSISTFSAL